MWFWISLSLLFGNDCPEQAQLMNWYDQAIEAFNTAPGYGIESPEFWATLRDMDIHIRNIEALETDCALKLQQAMMNEFDARYRFLFGAIVYLTTGDPMMEGVVAEYGAGIIQAHQGIVRALK